MNADVQVWATDVWFDAANNLQRVRDAEVDDGVFPIHADARSLPFATEFFDRLRESIRRLCSEQSVPNERSGQIDKRGRMRRTCLVGGVVATAMIVARLDAHSPPDFSGKWVLAPSQLPGMHALGADSSIAQDATTLHRVSASAVQRPRMVRDAIPDPNYLVLDGFERCLGMPAAPVPSIAPACLALTSALAPSSAGSESLSSGQAVAHPMALKGTDGPIYALAWAPDGQTLASAGYRQVNLWRLGADAPVRTFKAHEDLVFGVAWSPDGASIASVGDDGVARVWSAETLLETATLQTGPARAVKWSPDGRRLAIGSGVRMQVWRAASRELQFAALPQGQISSVSWSPDGQTVAVGSVNGMATLWSARTGSLLAKMNAGDQGRNDVNGVTWSPGGRILATAHGARGRGEIRLWNPAGGLLQTLASPSGWLRGIGWSPDGQWLAAGGEDGRVYIWNTETGEVALTLPTDSQPVWSVAWSPDGGRLAAGNTGSRLAGGTVSVWQAPVRVLPAGKARDRARAVETTLLKRGAASAPTASKTPRVAPVFKDDGAYGVVTGVEPPFGNLQTSFVQADLRFLGIATGDRFNIRCRDKAFPLLLGTSVDDVARGEWVAYFSLEDTLIVARYFGNAAQESECKVGDSVFIVKSR